MLYECTKIMEKLLTLAVLKMKKTILMLRIALEICLLISSQTVDFVVTGCSSGQGMMIACNSLPNLICGYLPTPRCLFIWTTK